MHKIKTGSPGSIYAVDGTPADCVKLGLAECFETPPDWVVAGINPGSNIGIDINYSGTAGAAREGALNGIPGLAVSVKLDRVMDYDNLARFVVHMVDAIGEKGLPSGTFLNVNAPGGAFLRFRVSGSPGSRRTICPFGLKGGRTPDSAAITGTEDRNRFLATRIRMSMPSHGTTFRSPRFNVISPITKLCRKCRHLALTDLVIFREA